MLPPQPPTEQYRTSANLEVRIGLHERFSTNPYPWMRWVFDHFEFPPSCRVLEAGCGNGKLWLENAQRIDPSWRISLSDVSAGMLAQAKANLARVQGQFGYQALAAESIPFGPHSFDAVIADHMLYYAEDLDRALAEIRRVLKPQSRLYASTNGLNHLKEIDDLIVGFRGGDRPIATVIEAFSLESGGNWIQRHFADVRLHRQENALLVNDPEALAAFCLSVSSAGIPEERRAEFGEYIRGQMRFQGGVMRIAKDAGLFTAVKA